MKDRKSLKNTSDKLSLSPPLPGFEHINRYWDRTNDMYAAKILPGQYYVTINNEIIVTVLGSCISACIMDPVAGVGGMNHFMLPKDADSDVRKANSSNAARYGNYAMELLINSILKCGGEKHRLQVKLFGGGRIIRHMSDVGQRNIEFVQEYVRTDGLNMIASDIGGDRPRKVYFFPESGKVKVKKLNSIHNNTILERETNYMKDLDTDGISGDVDLFYED